MRTLRYDDLLDLLGTTKKFFLHETDVHDGFERCIAVVARSILCMANSTSLALVSQHHPTKTSSPTNPA